MQFLFHNGTSTTISKQIFKTSQTGSRFLKETGSCDCLFSHKKPRAFKTFLLNMQYFATVSFGVQTNHIRQPLNNHTRPFYLPELMFNVRNTVSSSSGRRSRGSCLLPRLRSKRQCLRNIKPNHKGCQYPGRVLGDTQGTLRRDSTSKQQPK